MDHLYPDMLKVNSCDDIRRWWEVMDRTAGEAVPVEKWSYDEEAGDVTIVPGCTGSPTQSNHTSPHIFPVQARQRSA